MVRNRAFFLVVLVLVSVAATSPSRAAPSACAPFVPKVALRDDRHGAPGKPRKESLKAPVVKVGDSATQAHPVVRRITYGPALATPFYVGPQIIDGHKYLNFQVTTSASARGLYIRVDWPAMSVTDVDLSLYNAKGKMVGGSDATNAFPSGMENAVFDPIFGPRELHGGPGYESILGVSAQRCAGFMLDIDAYLSLGEELRLTAWLGKVRPQVY